MSTLSIDSTQGCSLNLDKYVPVDIDNDPIKWADNPAYLPGIIHEINVKSRAR